MLELFDILETLVDRGESHVGYLVELEQGSHNHLADFRRRNVCAVTSLKRFNHRIDDLVDLLVGDVALEAGPGYAAQQFLPAEVLSPPVAFDDGQLVFKDFLEGCEPVRAGQTFATTPYGLAIVRGATVKDFVVQITAFGATH